MLHKRLFFYLVFIITTLGGCNNENNTEEEIINKAKEHDLIFSMLPYNMVGTTTYKKLAAIYEKN